MCFWFVIILKVRLFSWSDISVIGDLFNVRYTYTRRPNLLTFISDNLNTKKSLAVIVCLGKHAQSFHSLLILLFFSFGERRIGITSAWIVNEWEGKGKDGQGVGYDTCGGMILKVTICEAILIRIEPPRTIADSILHKCTFLWLLHWHLYNECQNVRFTYQRTEALLALYKFEPFSISTEYPLKLSNSIYFLFPHFFYEVIGFFNDQSQEGNINVTERK